MITPTKSYNFIFDNEKQPGKASKHPHYGVIEPEILTPTRVEDGWIGSHGPNIPWRNWPRNPKNKLPMFHVITFRVPEEYRIKGEEYVGLSIFQGETLNSEDYEFDLPNSPFHKDFLEHVQHPAGKTLISQYEDAFAVIWLKEEQLQPKAPERDLTQPGENEISKLEEPNTWQKPFSYNPFKDYTPVWLVEREDLNTGKRPNEDNEDGYIDSYELDDAIVDNLYSYSHIGGTAFPVQGIPDGLTPYYVELEEFPGMNMGDAGNMQLDLKSDVVDWACG